jgi:hypothetical protein
METIKLLYDLFKLNSNEFYNLLVTLDFAVWTFFISVGGSLLVTIIYYYIIDRPKTAKLSVWLFFMLLTVIGLGITAYILASNAIIDYHLIEGLDVQKEVPMLTQDLIYFSLTNMLYSALLFLIFSAIIKWKSTNSSHVPF